MRAPKRPAVIAGIQASDRSTPSCSQHRALTHKMQSFACHVAAGMKLADAYRASFHTANMKPKTVRDEASRLAQNPGVTAAISAEREEIRHRNRISALKEEDRIWASIWALVENEEVAPSVRVKALHLAAQLCGMFTRPKPSPPVPASRIEAELAERFAEYSAVIPR